MNKIYISMLSALVVTSAYAGVADIKSSSPKSSLISDNPSYRSTINTPGFVSSDLGGDFSPQYKLDNMKGNLGRVDITNATGAPSINLKNSKGTNNDISDSSSGGAPAPKWHTIYNGSGTRYLNPPDQFSTFRIWFKYQKMVGRGHVSTSGSDSGAKGKSITLGSGGSVWYYCASQFQDKTTVSFTVGNTVSVPAATSACPDAAVRHIYVTRLDVYY